MIDNELHILNDAIKAGKITNPSRIKSIRCDLVRAVIEEHEKQVADWEQTIDEAIDALRIVRGYRDGARELLNILESE